MDKMEFLSYGQHSHGIVTDSDVLPGMVASHALWVNRHSALHAHVGGTP